MSTDHKRRRNADNRAMTAAKKAAGLTYASRIDAADVAARLAEIPPDTRSLTGRMFGDPLPGRSALARHR